MGTRGVDPQRVTGDLPVGPNGRTDGSLGSRIGSALRRRHRRNADDAKLPILALDWTGATSQMLIGRDTSCDLLIPNRTVSRHHAQLFFREGKWILIDLDSKNGTYIDGDQVERGELRPGTVVSFGMERMRVD